MGEAEDILSKSIEEAEESQRGVNEELTIVGETEAMGTSGRGTRQQEQQEGQQQEGTMVSQSGEEEEKEDEESEEEEQEEEEETGVKGYENCSGFNVNVEFNKVKTCIASIRAATTRYSGSKIQFNRAEQTEVSDRLNDLSDIFTAFAIALGEIKGKDRGGKIKGKASVDREGDKLEGIFRMWAKRTEDRFLRLEKCIVENRVVKTPLSLNQGGSMSMGTNEMMTVETPVEIPKTAPILQTKTSLPV
ncbi:rho GTPase-activating protein gacV-like [Sitophilus oryzae]|uniref:Rho GTPase-activating protein gacV-like n=1 Tax=Sitophilus oryzae TaxID=7048 RepID=A0A6J2YDN4_SITOR|nr:rho GTPase-activating protein gacV-like [Sitophilus oryzae]